VQPKSLAQYLSWRPNSQTCPQESFSQNYTPRSLSYVAYIAYIMHICCIQLSQRPSLFGSSQASCVFQSYPCPNHALRIAMIAKLRFASSSDMANRSGAPAQLQEYTTGSHDSIEHKYASCIEHTQQHVCFTFLRSWYRPQSASVNWYASKCLSACSYFSKALQTKGTGKQRFWQRPLTASRSLDLNSPATYITQSGSAYAKWRILQHIQLYPLFLTPDDGL